MTSERTALPTKTPPPLTLAIPENPLRVAFRWHEDRYVHSLLLDDTPVGHSVESGAEENWPASPPIQQLSLEEIDGHPVALGVGAAGQSHWSISVETYRADGTIGWKFDLACRCKSEPAGLASTYVSDQRVIIQSLPNSTLETTDSGVVIRPADSAGQTTCQWSYVIRRR